MYNNQCDTECNFVNILITNKLRKRRYYQFEMLWPVSFWIQFIRASVIMMSYMLFSFFLLFYASWYIPFMFGLFLSFSSFVMSPGIFQVCHSFCLLSYVFLFSFLDSSNPKDFHYPIYSSCFVMYESVASDISLIIIVAHSFEINHLYTSTLYGSNMKLDLR
jgi:hypothetical protein